MLTYHHATTTCDLWYQPLGDGYCVGSRRAVSHTHTRRTPDYSFSGRVLSIEAGPELESALAEELTDNAPDAPTLAELAHYPPRTRMVSPASDRCLCVTWTRLVGQWMGYCRVHLVRCQHTLLVEMIRRR